jgi:TetR/AcrR family transcriptional regulator, regulator of cefoperazone and chloramphenicol sensitivity
MSHGKSPRGMSKARVAHTSRQARSEATRQKVIDAAIECFGEAGFKGTSTRELVRRAGTNLVAIHYHFGSKSEVYRAAARYIARVARARVGGWIEPAEILSRRQHVTRRALLECLWTLFDRFFDDVLAGRPAGGVPDSWRWFMLREVGEPTEAFAIIYPSIRPLYETIFALIGRIINRPPQHQEVRLTAIMIFGQIDVFRTNRALALRFLGRRGLGRAKRLEIRHLARTQIVRLLTAGSSGRRRTRAIPHPQASGS